MNLLSHVISTRSQHLYPIPQTLFLSIYDTTKFKRRVAFIARLGENMFRLLSSWGHKGVKA